MKIIRTHESSPSDYDAMEAEWVYNGLDTCITLDVHHGLAKLFNNNTAATYAFSRELQAPVLEMKLRGILVDQRRKNEVVDDLFEKLEILERNLERIVLDGVGLPSFNWRSNADLHELFYERLRIPPITRRGRPTVDRSALERMENYLVARPIIAHITAMREIAKKIGVLRTEIDPDGRIRTSYNIAGTDTGRFSSSYTEFGTGGNLQNIEESLRSIFIADPGMKFAKFDAKSGESFCVGGIEWNLFQDGRYLDACESGDPHTVAARIVWPKLDWTGDLKRDKDIAERPFYRHNTYRFMCKKLGHGSNYGGKPATISSQTKLPVEVVSDFQRRYFTAFPAHTKWHGYVDTTLRKEGRLISLTGRERYFFGRRNDDSTLRAAIAYDPQGSLADIVNSAMLRIWRQDIAQLMMQDHDALTFQFPEEQEAEIVPQLLELLPQKVELRHGREMVIPYDCKTGWNRGDYSKENPDGLKDYYGQDKRTRTPQVGILDRPIRRGYR